MDKNEALKKLNEFIIENNLKKSAVESLLKMPLNSLSNFVSGKKEMPNKWVQPILDFLSPEKVINNTKQPAQLPIQKKHHVVISYKEKEMTQDEREVRIKQLRVEIAHPPSSYSCPQMKGWYKQVREEELLLLES